MFVVGTGKGATGTGYGQMPDFDSNYALAERITNTLKGIDPGLTRDIRVSPGAIISIYQISACWWR